jgi:hypothetical protein
MRQRHGSQRSIASPLLIAISSRRENAGKIICKRARERRLDPASKLAGSSHIARLVVSARTISFALTDQATTGSN